MGPGLLAWVAGWAADIDGEIMMGGRHWWLDSDGLLALVAAAAASATLADSARDSDYLTRSASASVLWLPAGYLPAAGTARQPDSEPNLKMGISKVGSAYSAY